MHWLVLLTLLTTCLVEAVSAACSGNNCLRGKQWINIARRQTVVIQD